jgi:crossover junction endodeoxyribonuclease RuvC
VFGATPAASPPRTTGPRRLRVTGVDPGLSRCGIGTVVAAAGGGVLVRADVVRTTADLAHGHRLAAVDRALRAAVTADRPDVLAVERVFLNQQKVTGIGALQVVGLVHLLGAALDLPVVEYTPSQVKGAVTGNGDADKGQVGYMVARMLDLPAIPKPADRADALAVALCHLSRPARDVTAPRPTSSRGRSDPSLPPRLAAALDGAGPGLAPVRPRGGGPRGGETA